MGQHDDQASSPLGKTTAPGHAPALASGEDLPPGYVVGEYRVRQVLGRGGMGVVYAGVQPLIEKRVAIKVLNAELSSDPALVRRFLDEARAVNRIRHPNIIDIFSFGQLVDRRQYFVMEYLEGRTLAERMQAGDLPAAELPPLLGQICDALDAAHTEHIVHRDLKPENIWIVEPRRGRPFIKLLDFGIAKLLASGEQATTQAGVLMGTPQYMSPEQCHGRGIDHRTDIYALGVILYQLYGGTLPFRGETFAEVLTKQLTELPTPPSQHATIPTALDSLILRCLSKEAAARPQSARELGEALAAILGPQPLAGPSAMLATSPTQTPTTTTLRGSAQGLEAEVRERRSARRWPLPTALILVAATTAAVAVYLARPAPRSTPGVAIPDQSTMPPQPAPLAVVAVDAGAALVGASPPAATSGPPAERPPPNSQRSHPAAAGSEGRRRSVGRAPTGSPGRSRASQNGLVTDNPFR